MYLPPKSFVEPETFFCRGFGKRMPILTCMKNFVDANALAHKDKPCFKCEQGNELRCSFSKS